MDSDCLTLLPAVCLVLADPKQSPPDDTSLEKLLDWFKELHSQSDEQVLLQHQPCLKEFISSVCPSKTTDPAILSFTLKLTGLLAGTKQGFHLLEEGGLLVCVFDREAWCVCDLWEDASVRSGWMQGLMNMLKHRQALDFICQKGLIKVILQLQNDRSLFVACLANQLLVHILNFLTSSNMTNRGNAVGSSESSLSPDWVSVSTEIMNGEVEALSSDDHPRVLQGLRLLSSVTSQCGEPIRSMLWKDVLVPLEVLINRGSESLTQPLMSVLQAAVRTPLLGKSEYKVEKLLEAMLGSGNKKSFQCAALIIKLEKCPEVLKRKAIDIILLPLQCVSAQSQDTAEKMNLVLKEQLSQKASCISLLMQSLSSLAELAYTKYQFDGISIHSVTCSVVLLLRICFGNCPSTLLHINTSTHLIGCCKVQRCGLDTLGALSMYEENVDLRKDIFSVLLDYLQSPDSHATVLKKTYQPTVRWIAVCSPFPDLLHYISHDLFPVLEKRTCDLRWEVRDSTLEFITQLTVALNGNIGFIEALHTSGMVSVLLSSLADAEGYVRASAVAAVGEAVTSSFQQMVLVSNSNLLEEALKQMMTILSQDTEGFPRRAVVKAFTSWLKGSHLVTAVHPSLSSVLSLGGNDFDWEVKMHTLELAEVLMEKTLTCCPYAVQNFGSSEKTHLTQALSKLKEFGLFDLLFNCLFDCDRPVCEKACALLLKLRTLISECTDFDYALVLNVNGNRWGDEVQSRYLNKQQAKGSVCVTNGVTASDERTDSDLHCIKDISLPMILHILDLDDMQRTLKLSSDHVVNSARSLMEDILSAAQQSEENTVDCY
ncbi:BRCA1-associated ATM activator 1 isoform X1 [Megalobrama amblycephala]|uniref:BRCA1-associated ATM activator 1 isoform X1 n=1 Tax=Megalobrama amblycephala TaxID=75352 RepID=UPI00201415E1|nr:BRCA1-associated ATM activator 1 isoform X1 [Megalobrama amblycephala]XP_048053220.1 BRCA1-associated ATM activator 1 isoform X1 [Megalobrama amblycephala]